MRANQKALMAHLNIIQNNDVSSAPFVHLQQLYEHEFSIITGYQTDERGLYDSKELMSHWSDTFDVFVLYDQKRPVGFSVINLKSMISLQENVRDMAEFFILPDARKHGLGQWFAHELFKKYPGQWQVRQLPGLAVKYFLCKTIDAFTKGNFKNNDITCSAWKGSIQEFVSSLNP